MSENYNSRNTIDTALELIDKVNLYSSMVKDMTGATIRIASRDPTALDSGFIKYSMKAMLGDNVFSSVRDLYVNIFTNGVCEDNSAHESMDDSEEYYRWHAQNRRNQNNNGRNNGGSNNGSTNNSKDSNIDDYVDWEPVNDLDRNRSDKKHSAKQRYLSQKNPVKSDKKSDQNNDDFEYTRFRSQFPHT